MYRCLYCNVILKKGTEKIFEEHESGNRHKMNKILFFKNKYIKWIEKDNN
jgi:hypothetical protein